MTTRQTARPAGRVREPRPPQAVETEPAPEPGDRTAAKLCIIIVASEDGDRLLDQLVESGFPGTLIGSTGGFLRRGSATVISAVPGHQVSKLVAMLHRDFPVRTDFIAAHQLAYFEDQEFTERVEVRVGGAVMFVLNIDRLEQT